MITDLILLLVLLAMIGGILLLVTASSHAPSATTSRGSRIDWNKGEVQLKSNLRPVSQQDLLDQARSRGQDGGRYVAQHANSFSFGHSQSRAQ